MHTRLAALVAVRYVPVIAPAETGGLEAVYEKLLGLASLNLRLDEVDVGACVGKCTASVFDFCPQTGVCLLPMWCR